MHIECRNPSNSNREHVEPTRSGVDTLIMVSSNEETESPLSHCGGYWNLCIVKESKECSTVNTMDVENDYLCGGDIKVHPANCEVLNKLFNLCVIKMSKIKNSLFHVAFLLKKFPIFILDNTSRVFMCQVSALFDELVHSLIMSSCILRWKLENNRHGITCIANFIATIPSMIYRRKDLSDHGARQQSQETQLALSGLKFRSAD